MVSHRSAYSGIIRDNRVHRILTKGIECSLHNLPPKVKKLDRWSSEQYIHVSTVSVVSLTGSLYKIVKVSPQRSEDHEFLAWHELKSIAVLNEDSEK